jgi:hypothetical protein
VTTVSLSLISHTNAGKTTLARTLLARDVGEVRDAPHVTEFAEDYPLVQSSQGDVLMLWDTPGFGDSARLAKRLKGSKNPLGWFLAEVWDRFRDRAFYASQQAMRNVRDRADVVLYLVNASETPESAAYIEPEMELLDWLGRPVVVLLNQLGAPREAEIEDAEVGRWRQHLTRYSHVRSVTTMDAFARCWVQEFELFAQVQAVLPPDKHDAMQGLRAAWRERRLVTFEAAVDEMAASLARIAALREILPESGGMRDTLRTMGSTLGNLWRQATRDAASAADESTLPPQVQAAQRALADKANTEIQESLSRLIAMHGLDGRAHAELSQRIARHYELELRIDEGKAAVLGGAVSGALGGLAADVASAGMTFGGGMIAGAVLGALAAAGAARGINIVRGRDQSWIGWSAAALEAMVEAALLRYLAVAHFGRGRGDWKQGEAPAHWRTIVQQVMREQQHAWSALWQARRDGAADDTRVAMSAPSAAALRPVLREAAVEILRRLYPRAMSDIDVESSTPPVAQPSPPSVDAEASTSLQPGQPA